MCALLACRRAGNKKNRLASRRIVVPGAAKSVAMRTAF
jgi:hypothetical protein